MNSLNVPTPVPDSSRKGWIVAGSMFVMLGIVIAGRNSLGLLMPFWENDLGWSYGFVSNAGAVTLTIMAVVAPAGGMLLDRFGPRVIYATGMTLIGVVFVLCSFMTEQWHLIVVFSVFGGMGFAVVSPSLVSATVARYFYTKVGLATSIAASGATGGQLALMPLLGLMVVSFAWRPSLLVLGIAILVTALVVQFLIRDTADDQQTIKDNGAVSFRPSLNYLARDKTFWLLTCGFFICGFTTAGVIKIHLIPYAVSCGFPPLESAFAYGLLSFFSMLGMIGCGYLTDRVNRPMLLAGIYCMRALTFILLMQIAGSPTALFTFAILFGLFDYATFPVVASLVASHIGRHIMGLTMGLIFAGHSLGGAVGSFVGGYLFDLFGRYDWLWIVSVALAALAGLLSILIAETHARNDHYVPVQT